MRLAVDKLQEKAFMLRDAVIAENKDTKLVELLKAVKPIKDQIGSEEAFKISQDAADKVQELLKNATDAKLKALKNSATYLTDKTVLIVGGDGWAYDIGYGGLDHVIASGRNVKILVMDTEVYSNTGGQRSKATTLGAVAKFAAGGKEIAKKDLGLMCMGYKSAYIASINFGANPMHTVKALNEAMQFNGTSLVIAYSNCIEHGINMATGPEHAKLACDSGYWLLYRYDPRMLEQKKNPLMLDTKEITKPVKEFLEGQRRFKTLMESKPDAAHMLFDQAQKDIHNRFEMYKQMAAMDYSKWE